MNLSSSDERSANIVYCALNSASVLLCLLAAIMVFYLKLHKKIVYRLSLYQVLSALAFSAVKSVQIVFYFYGQLSQVHKDLCSAIGFLDVYTQWVKLLFTAWVTTHLFAFVVLDKNLKKMEALYVVTSLVAPVIVAIVPLITHTYIADPLGCYIGSDNDTDNLAEIETFVLWDVPAIIILLASSAAMVAMAISLGYRAYRTRTHVPITRGNQYHTALKQLLPLVAFPILFFVFQFPVLVFDIYVAGGSSAPDVTLVASVFIPMWSMSSGMILVCHILQTQLYHKRKIHFLRNPHVDVIKDDKVQYSSCENTVKDSSYVDVISATHFSLPNDSMRDCNDPSTCEELHL